MCPRGSCLRATYPKPKPTQSGSGVLVFPRAGGRAEQPGCTVRGAHASLPGRCRSGCGHGKPRGGGRKGVEPTQSGGLSPGPRHPEPHTHTSWPESVSWETRLVWINSLSPVSPAVGVLWSPLPLPSPGRRVTSHRAFPAAELRAPSRGRRRGPRTVLRPFLLPALLPPRRPLWDPRRSVSPCSTWPGASPPHPKPEGSPASQLPIARRNPGNGFRMCHRGAQVTLACFL